VHHFYALGTYNTVEGNLQLLLSGKLPFIAAVVHRDWVLEPLQPPEQQARLGRYNASYVTLKWTNEARHYQRSQLHQVWEEAKCFELMAWHMRRYGYRYRSIMRHRSDFNVTLLPPEAASAALIAEWAAGPAWPRSLYIPEGEDWRVRVWPAGRLERQACSAGELGSAGELVSAAAES
jgi:hypothetical protein